MFPTIFALGIEALGRNTKVGGPLIIVAIVGGASGLLGVISFYAMAKNTCCSVK
jgi:FHS family L-fucose permease-like MFS transporter